MAMLIESSLTTITCPNSAERSCHRAVETAGAPFGWLRTTDRLTVAISPPKNPTLEVHPGRVSVLRQMPDDLREADM